MRRRKNLHIIPIAVCLLCPLTFVITFVIAVLEKHVEPAFPYISDTGAEAPESCIFSQLLNIASLLLAICVYIRHLQVAKFTNFRGLLPHKLRANYVATVLGYLSCLGMCIVANFQVTNLWQVHYLGAALCFFGGTVYFVFQTFFSYHMGKVYGSRAVFYYRVSLCLLTLVFNFTAVIPGIYSQDEYKGNPDDTLFWNKSDGGFSMHIISTVSEWLLAISQSALVLTFLPEFRGISISAPVIQIDGVSGCLNPPTE